jgi:hypothetical protein
MRDILYELANVSFSGRDGFSRGPKRARELAELIERRIQEHRVCFVRLPASHGERQCPCPPNDRPDAEDHGDERQADRDGVDKER